MVRIGDLMVEEGLVCPEDVDQVVALQNKDAKAKGRLFGKVLCDLSLVTPMDNYCVLEKYKKVVSVKSFLVQKKVVSPARLEEIEAGAFQKGRPFISALLEAEIVSKPQLQQILSELFHIPFRSVSDIVFSEESRTTLSSVLDKEQAARHMMIPLQLSGKNLVMGITDPANLVFLRALDRGFPQYRFTPVFIAFSGFTWFYKLIYKENLHTADEILFDFSVTLTDPVRDEAAVKALYERYKACCKNGGGADSPDTGRDIDSDMERQILFFEFIRRNYRMIVEKFNCRAVEFSLKQKQGRTLVTALPVEGRE